MTDYILPDIEASCPSEEDYWSLFKLALLITIYERVCVLWHIRFLRFAFFWICTMCLIDGGEFLLLKKDGN